MNGPMTAINRYRVEGRVPDGGGGWSDVLDEGTITYGITIVHGTDIEVRVDNAVDIIVTDVLAIEDGEYRVVGAKRIPGTNVGVYFCERMARPIEAKKNRS